MVVKQVAVLAVGQICEAERPPRRAVQACVRAVADTDQRVPRFLHCAVELAGQLAAGQLAGQEA